MFPNLRAEMARNNIKITDIAGLLNVSEKTVRNYINGKTNISWFDSLKIKNTLFPKASLEYLFATEEKTEQTS